MIFMKSRDRGNLNKFIILILFSIVIVTLAWWGSKDIDSTYSDNKPSVLSLDLLSAP